jgi:hypothetical protein
MAWTMTVGKTFQDPTTGTAALYEYVATASTESDAISNALMWATMIEVQFELEQKGFRPSLPFLISDLYLYLNTQVLLGIKRRVGDDAVQQAYGDAIPELTRLLGNKYDIVGIIADEQQTDQKTIDARKEVIRLLKWLTIKNLYGSHEVVPPTAWYNIKRTYDDINSLKNAMGWMPNAYRIEQTTPKTDGFGSVERPGGSTQLFEDNSY